MLNRNIKMMLVPVLLLVMVFAFVGCSGGDNNSGTNNDNDGQQNSAAKLELVFGHNDPVNSIGSEAALLFAELVEEKSGGTMTMEVFPANQLGKNRDLIEQTQQGVIDFTMGGIGNLGFVQPEFNMTSALFVFKDQAHIRSVVEGDVGRRLADTLLEQDLRMVSFTWDRFPRQIVSNRKIVEPEDMRGLVIRAGYAGADVPLRALGASPTEIPLAEMYTALSQGVVEAVEMPWSYILGESLYEVADYVVLTDNTFMTYFFAMSDKTYQEMTPEQREIIFAAAEEAGIYNNQQKWSQIEEYKEQLLGYGVEFVTPNRQGMIDVVKNNVAELEELWGIPGFYDEINDEKYLNAEVDYINTAPSVAW